MAYQHTLTAAQLFRRCKTYFDGSLVTVDANEAIVLATELQDVMNHIKQLERALGHKTLKNKTPKEAVDFAKEKKQIFCPLLLHRKEQ